MGLREVDLLVAASVTAWPATGKQVPEWSVRMRLPKWMHLDEAVSGKTEFLLASGVDAPALIAALEEFQERISEAVATIEAMSAEVTARRRAATPP